MKAGTDPTRSAESTQLLHVDSRTSRFRSLRFTDFPSLLSEGDLLVLNDAATLPASLMGAGYELRLAGELPSGAWRAVLFGTGDWREDTDARSPPPPVNPGAGLQFGPQLSATVESVSELSPRLLTVRFDRTGAALWGALHDVGRTVQYSYLERPLQLEEVQTAYAARPWACEMPSAGRPLRWKMLQQLKERGVGIATVTHAAGLSATGDPRLDKGLPLPERYDIPAATVEAVAQARRVYAVGTTVLRALEGAARDRGRLMPGEGVTDLRVGPQTPLRVVDGILSGMHEPGTTHFELLGAVAPLALLEQAARAAETWGYQVHELGDSIWVT